MTNPPVRDEVYVDIYAGGTLDGGIDLDLIDEGDEPLTHADGWRLRCQVKSSSGDLVFTLAESGADGTIVLDDYGHVLIYLPSSFTVNLTPAGTPTAGRAYHLGDFDLWNTAAPSVIYKPPAVLRVRVYSEVTTS